MTFFKMNRPTQNAPFCVSNVASCVKRPINPNLLIKLVCNIFIFTSTLHRFTMSRKKIEK